MTVYELKRILDEWSDDTEVLYFDSESGEDVPMSSSYITFDGDQVGLLNEWKKGLLWT